MQTLSDIKNWKRDTFSYDCLLYCELQPWPYTVGRRNKGGSREHGGREQGATYHYLFYCVLQPLLYTVGRRNISYTPPLGSVYSTYTPMSPGSEDSCNRALRAGLFFPTSGNDMNHLDQPAVFREKEKNIFYICDKY